LIPNVRKFFVRKSVRFYVKEDPIFKTPEQVILRDMKEILTQWLQVLY